MRDATHIDEYFSGDKTLFLIPLYQRKYAWKRKHCERFFADLMKVNKEGRKSHFFGSIVTVKANDVDDDLLIIDIRLDSGDNPPRYTGNFEQAYSDILRGCRALLYTL